MLCGTFLRVFNSLKVKGGYVVMNEERKNSFMYEPIIDMSDWALKTLYQEVLNISNK